LVGYFFLKRPKIENSENPQIPHASFFILMTQYTLPRVANITRKFLNTTPAKTSSLLQLGGRHRFSGRQSGLQMSLGRTSPAATSCSIGVNRTKFSRLIGVISLCHGRPGVYPETLPRTVPRSQHQQ